MLSRFLTAFLLALFVTISWAAPGDLDLGFGEDGWVNAGFQTAPANAYAYSMTQQVDGKLVVAGYSYNGVNDDFAVARYNPDGSLDAGFGTGGKVTTVVGTSNDQGYSVVQQTDGKLVVAGSSYTNSTVRYDFALVRYHPDGSLDTGFGTGGKVVTHVGGNSDKVWSVIQQSDGKLVAAGEAAMVRYNSDGSLDTSFGGDGMLTTEWAGLITVAYSVIQQSDGKLVVAGYSSGSNFDFTLLRYNLNGTLDTTFDGDGKAVTAASFSNDVAYSVIQQSDGKLVAAGYAASSSAVMVRYNSNGSLDTSFDGDGMAITAVGVVDDFGHSVVQQSDGKLVTVGYVRNGSYRDFAVLRYNSNGSLDTGFDGDGIATTIIGSLDDRAYAVVQQADGKLVAAGYGRLNGIDDFSLVRYSSNGALDTAFDADGILSTRFFFPQDSAESVVEQSDGKLVVFATAWNGTAQVFALARFGSDGSRDATFDGDGQLTTSFSASGGWGESVIQQSDGKIVAGGFSANGGAYFDFAVARYNSDGSLDSTFDGDGMLTTDIGTFGDAGRSIIQQADGKLVLAGNAYNGNNDDFAMVRYNIDGSLDTTFSGDGKQITPVGINSSDIVWSAIQQSNGKLVLAGNSNNGSNNDFAVVRYNIDGSLDTTFSGDGKLTTAVGTGDDYVNAVIQQLDGKLVAAGHSYDGTKTVFALVRYNSNGALDTTFDGDGKVTTAVGMESSYGRSVIQQADGKLVVAGNASNGSYTDFALVRYNSNGSLDTGFGNGGILTADMDGSDDFVTSLIRQSDGKFVVAGYNFSGGSRTKMVLLRLMGEYVAPDTDGDGISDELDNCISVSNADQLNTDGDAQGNACDTDDDNDTVLDTADNCSLNANLVQTDTDSDGLGDVCDDDDDNDGVVDISDAFPLDATESVDTDSDGIGNNADTTPNGDTDNDGIDNLADNCVTVSNIDQLNTDGDSEGNACDTDDDNDGAADISDAFPLDASESVDTDSDGVGDNADTTPNGDTDNDGIDNAVDNCVSVSNANQLNTDGDSEGNVCDNDDDNDGVADASDAFPLDASESVDTDSDTVGDNADNCIAVANTDQLDTDTDGAGDVCDNTPNGDTDNDGIDNAIDNCVSVSNADQLNTDNDAQGDACDSDDDNDSVQDGSDNCPLIANSNQLDYDADNIGDACDEAVPLPEDIAGVMKNAKAGSAVAFAGDVNGDGYGDYVIGMPGYDIPAVPPVKIIKGAGRAEVISGKTGAVLMSINGVAAKDAMGFAVAGNGDIDNDGFDDVLVGAPNADDFAFGLADAGSATILFGPNGNRTRTFFGNAKKLLSGSAVALADVNGDDHADMIIGAPKADDVARGLVDAGNVTVISGNGYSILNTLYVAKAKANAGTSVAAGDINHDGNADIIIGAPKDDDAANKLKDAGSVSVYDISGTELLRKYGAAANAHFGESVASGDVNHDGVDDVLVGAPDDDNGKIKDVGSVTVFSGSDASPLIKKFGAVAKANLGNSVTAGDVNADGYADIIAGAKLDDKPGAKTTKDTGSVSVWSGNGYGLINTVYGDAANDYFGAAVSAGDINSDGNSDLIIGIPGFGIVMKDAGGVTVLSGVGL